MRKDKGWLFIKSRYLFLLFLLTAGTAVSAFLFVDNKLTGKAIYEPSDVLDFVKKYAKETVLEREKNLKEAVGETFSEALKEAIDKSIEQAFSPGPGTYTKPKVRKVYVKEPAQKDVVYVERDDDKEMMCRVVCEAAE